MRLLKPLKVRGTESDISLALHLLAKDGAVFCKAQSLILDKLTSG